MQSEEETRHALAIFVEKGPTEWADGKQIAEQDQVLAFASYLWQLEVRDGNVTVQSGGRTPEEVLTGGNLKDLAEHVNSSPIGLRWASGGNPLARTQFWPELVVPLPNPANVAWAFSAELGTYAGAGEIQIPQGKAIGVVTFPRVCTTVLHGLRECDCATSRLAMAPDPSLGRGDH